MSRKNTFKKIYIIFAGVLAIIMIACLIHVGLVLKEYEASQPENQAIEQFKIMRKAANNGTLKELLSSYSDGEVDEEFALSTAELLNSADGELSCRLLDNAQGGEMLTYTVSSDGKRIADISLMAKGNGDTKLMLFTMTNWEIVSMWPAGYTYSMALPASMTVLINGEVMSGTDTDSDGITDYYFSRYFEEPEVIVRDSIGKETLYDGETKLSVTEYTVQMPSNFSISSADGSVTVPADTAQTIAIDNYRYVSQYTQMPELATYRIGILGDTPDFVITDNLGNTVDYILDGHTVKIEDQASLPEVPEDVYPMEDILENARKWSLFMTADLTGAKHGFGQVEKFLLPDSYLMEVAYKWATGVDITFTSVHTLDDPPFSEESVSNYVRYSDICFSVDVKLTKIMHLNTSNDVTDTMNCRFYYIQNDGVWYIADIQEIIG